MRTRTRATPKWIEGHTDEIIASVERLRAAHAVCGPMVTEFLDRLAWLPPLLVDLDESRLPLHA